MWILDKILKIKKDFLEGRTARENTIFQEAFKAGKKEGSSVTYQAVIHNFKPRFTKLPKVEDGYRRLFWIKLEMNLLVAMPVNDRFIHWEDSRIGFYSTNFIGAPCYSWIHGSKEDNLVMMGVVYYLSSTPSELL